MADGSMAVGAETNGAGEGRVHQDDAGARRVRERGIDRRPVMAGDQRIRECMGQARAARRGIFVELETGMIPAMSDQKSVTGARLQNDVVRPDSRQDERNGGEIRSEEHTSELQSLMRISYAVFCLKKQKNKNQH